MKATGIVRRIDDLGRVVIPKEIRRTMRIREGEPLEIFTDNDGEVIFKKYSPVGELANFAGQFADVLYKTLNIPVVVFDRDHVIAASGIGKKEVLERRISSALEDSIDNRKSYFRTTKNDPPLYPIEGLDRMAIAAMPIIVAGDIAGAIAFLGTDETGVCSEADSKIMHIASDFLSRQMEN